MAVAIGQTTASRRQGRRTQRRPDDQCKALCQTTSVRYTTRDAAIGAGIMLAGSLILAIIGIALKQRGYGVAGDVVATNGFFFSLVLSMPFWILKGQSRLAQVMLVGCVLLMLTAATYVAYQI